MLFSRPRFGMGIRALLRFLYPLAAFFAATATPSAAWGQEIALRRCDSLPVIKVAAAGRPAWFLVDTAATSMLNLNSFGQGPARSISVTSWRGTLATSAKEVTIGELAVGRTKILALTVSAIELSAIGKACGQTIDGILGVDLLAGWGGRLNLSGGLLH